MVEFWTALGTGCKSFTAPDLGMVIAKGSCSLLTALVPRDVVASFLWSSSSRSVSFSSSLSVLEGVDDLCCALRGPGLPEAIACCNIQLGSGDFLITFLPTALPLAMTEDRRFFGREKMAFFLPRFVPGKVTLDVSSTSLTRLAGTTSHHSSPPLKFPSIVY